jgi:hypothetical protein
VIVPRDATSALDPFDLEASLRQITFLFNGRVTESANIRVEKKGGQDVYQSKIEEAAEEVSRDR